MRSTTRIDIQTIVARAKSADVNAFGALYDTYLDAIYRFVYFRVATREDAEDITEQIFMYAFTHIRQYEERGVPFDAWLYRIARNKVIDHYRTSHVTVSIAEGEDMVDEEKSPEELTEERMDFEFVRAKMKMLSERYQEIIQLKYIEDKENEEISVILDKPVDQIRVLQSRAIAKLKQLLRL